MKHNPEKLLKNFLFFLFVFQFQIHISFIDSTQIKVTPPLRTFVINVTCKGIYTS